MVNGKIGYGWQYTSTGKINGIAGYVDRNKFTEDILLHQSKPLPNPPNSESISQSYVFYTVKKGDTLTKIANIYNTSISNIIALNSNIKNPNLIFPGQQFKILNGSSNSSSYTYYTIRKGDTLSAISKKYGTTVNNIVKLNNIKNKNLIYPNQTIRINITTSNILYGGENSCGKILYKIKYGDNLSTLAKKFDSSVDSIVKVNNISNPNLIYAGSLIRIPTCNLDLMQIP